MEHDELMKPLTATEEKQLFPVLDLFKALMGDDKECYEYGLNLLAYPLQNGPYGMGRI